MSRSVDDKLSRLRSRRFDSSDYLSSVNEAYERRSASKATRYALGAMQEVAPKSTSISLEEAEKVRVALAEGLSEQSIYPAFDLQGSVPLNVHIRGASDIDLLMIEGSYLRKQECLDSKCSYLPYTGLGRVVDDVLALRRKAESLLRNHFYGSDVDVSGDKSITLSGGGFRRKVDVVPSSWYDTEAYQRTLSKVDRAIEIANKSTGEPIKNYPFKYISEIKKKALTTNDGARMAIRLAKNIKNDSEEDIELSSYDIGSLVFRCGDASIMHLAARDLMILSGLDSWLYYLVNNQNFAQSLLTPDESRKIIDSPEKWRGLRLLQSEINGLAAEVALELADPPYPAPLDRDTVRKRLMEQAVPL